MASSSADGHPAHRLVWVAHRRGRDANTIGQEIALRRDLDETRVRLPLGIGRHPLFQLLQDLLIDICRFDYPGPAVKSNGRIRQRNPRQEDDPPFGYHRHRYVRVSPDVAHLPRAAFRADDQCPILD